MRGLRTPNLNLRAQEDQQLLLYEFCRGLPLVMAGCAPDWSAEASSRFAETVHRCAQDHGLQSVVLVGEEVPLGRPPEGAATAVDGAGLVRKRLFGLGASDEGAIQVADPNLRVVDGASIEASALSSALEEGLHTLIKTCLAELETEAGRGPSLAPVLVVPRVLSPEVCQALVASFGSWRPEASPVPSDAGLIADPDRKRRLDTFIGDPSLERELMQGMAQRILPELEKAFWFRATHFERLKLVCYRAESRGHFETHRDNTAPATAHRRFALTLNLNSSDYEGGALEFPEYGRDCAVDVPTGAALLFSCTHAHRVRPVTHGDRYALVSFAYAVDRGSDAAAPTASGAL